VLLGRGVVSLSVRSEGPLLGKVFTRAVSPERVYRAVAPRTWVPSLCSGNVFTELAVPWQRPVNNNEVVFSFGSVLRLYKGGSKPDSERRSEGTMLARGVRKPARATTGISASNI
jgi:hypothetical protein